MKTGTILVVLMLLMGACRGSDELVATGDIAVGGVRSAAAQLNPTSEAMVETESVVAPTVAAGTSEEPVVAPTVEAAFTMPIGEVETFVAEVWADNWMAFYVNGELVAEDSVPITTERSFNAEVFTFTAVRPFTIAIEAKDFKQTDSGIEYIGARNQQMGDGGIIAQVANSDTGEVVAATNDRWATLVAHRAPLNTSCEKDADPDATCEFEITEPPANWATVDFDDRSWVTATEWSEAAVSPKDGYDQISWNAAAQLVWGTDLEVDNTVLLRWTVGAS